MLDFFSSWIDSTDGIATISVPNEVAIRSSCYPLPDFVRIIALDIRDEALMSSVVSILDCQSRLLFTVDITTPEILLRMEQFPQGCGFIQFENRYTIQIN